LLIIELGVFVDDGAEFRFTHASTVPPLLVNERQELLVYIYDVDEKLAAVLASFNSAPD
jgi:hypothetical protein